MSKHLTLYGAKTGNSIRAAIGLEEAGLPYTIERVALSRGEHKREPYLSMNPLGQVPALAVADIDGQVAVITQSNAIILYAAENANGNDLLGKTPEVRAKTFERFFYFVTDVIVPSNIGFRLKGTAFADAAQHLDATVVSSISYANAFLGSHPFMAGDAFSIADIAAVTIVSAYADVIDWPKLPDLGDWFKRVSERDGVRHGFAAFSPG